MADFVQVPMPFICNLLIERRMYIDLEESDDPIYEVMGCVSYTFLPPESTSEWPKTMEDIGKSEVQRLLKSAKNGAAGSNFLLMRF